MMTLISIWPPLKFLYSMTNIKYILLYFFPFFQIEGEVEKDSEVRATYKDLHAKVWSPIYINTLYLYHDIFQRPICQKLIDHTEEIQPREDMEETSEYRDTLNKIEVRGD